MKYQQMKDIRFISVEKRTDMPTCLHQTNLNPPEGIPIIQVYAPTSGSEVDHFYQQLQETIDQTYIQVVQGVGMLKLGRMHRQTWDMFLDPTAMLRQMR